MTLSLQGIEFAYGNDGFALVVPALEIQPGESVALVGPSGCGKTTLLNLIAGILKPDRGRICLRGEELSTLTKQQLRKLRLQNLGMIFQSFELLDYLDSVAIVENIIKYEDHHYFTDFEMEQFKKIYDNITTDNTVFLTTEKDATRLELHKDYLMKHNIPVFVLPAKVAFLDDDDEGFQ